VSAHTPGLEAFGVSVCDACGMQFRPTLAALREYEKALEADPDLALYCFTCDDYLARKARGSHA
jgi:hypothetical protein